MQKIFHQYSNTEVQQQTLRTQSSWAFHWSNCSSGRGITKFYIASLFKCSATTDYRFFQGCCTLMHWCRCLQNERLQLEAKAKADSEQSRAKFTKAQGFTNGTHKKTNLQAHLFLSQRLWRKSRRRKSVDEHFQPSADTPSLSGSLNHECPGFNNNFVVV